MANPDLSTLTTNFVKFGGVIFQKHVNDFDAAMPGIRVFKNVKAPIPMPKLSAVGNPRPYAAADNITSQGVKYTDRVLTVYQSKWDMDIDPEVYRNTYLATDEQVPFYQYILDQVSKEYLAAINDSAAYLGTYNAAGTTAAAIGTGWGTIIAAEITATTLTPIVTGAITASNAVTKVELVAEGVPVWMRKMGYKIYCSYAVLDMYKKHYRATYGFTFDKSTQGKFILDNMNCELVPVSWMGTSQRLIATIDNNLCMGTDGDSISIPSSMRRNIIELRALMPVGFQIADLDAIVVNDQA